VELLGNLGKRLGRKGRLGRRLSSVTQQGME
jgi:hypothetical protein